MARTVSDKGGPGPSLIDLLAMSYDMKELVHPNINDTLIDHLISIIQNDKEEDISSILEERCAGWDIAGNNGEHGTHLIFANYIFHHHYAQVWDGIQDTFEGGKVAQIVDNWKEKLWIYKDWSVIPQDILEEDFKDHCYYHSHTGTCWRKGRG